ncbi:MAG: YcxB family protein [Candidatus Acidiferrales bacterium]
MSETVSISFRYAARDYVRALRAHYSSRLRVRSDIVAATVVALLGVYTWRSPQYHWLSIFCLVASFVLILMLFAAFVVIPPLAFHSGAKFRDDYSLTFSPDGIHFLTAHIDSHLQWNLYSRALIDEHSYLLYYGSRQFTVIPKRVFQNAEQQHLFEQLLTQHVFKIVRRDLRVRNLP